MLYQRDDGVWLNRLLLEHGSITRLFDLRDLWSDWEWVD